MDATKDFNNKSIRVFDSHLHIINPQFALIENNGFLPKPYLVADYLQELESVFLQAGKHSDTYSTEVTPRFELVGGAIVSGSFQAHDTSYLKHALAQFNQNNKFAVGVISVQSDISNDEILALDALGVRAIRFNLYRSPIKYKSTQDLDAIKNLAAKVYEVAGWHVELYVDASQLDDLLPTLLQLSRLSIDHLALSKRGFKSVITLIEQGAYIKATGFSRGDLNISRALKTLLKAHPQRLIFGSDLPSTRAKVRFCANDFKHLLEHLNNQLLNQVLCDNALDLYRIS